MSIVAGPKIGLYFCFAGHGIAYIPTLTYINVRASKTSYRNINVSIAHLMYFIGIAVAASCSNGKFDSFHQIQKSEFLNLSHKVGVLLLCSSLVILAGLVATEMFKNRFTVCDYKKSLDESVDMEIFSSQIFNQKYFLRVQDMPVADFRLRKLAVKELSMFMFVITSKVSSLVYLFYPFYFYTIYLTNQKSLELTAITRVHCMGVVGLTISILLLKWLSSKVIFLISLSLKLISIVIVTILFQTSFQSYGFMVFMWIFMCFNAFGYSLSDVFIIDFANLKFNEIILAIGYTAEMMITGIVFYNFIISGPAAFNTNVILNQCLSFGIVYVVLTVSAILLIPRTHYKSLLETKNLTWVQYYNLKSFLKCDN